MLDIVPESDCNYCYYEDRNHGDYCQYRITRDMGRKEVSDKDTSSYYWSAKENDSFDSRGRIPKNAKDRLIQKLYRIQPRPSKLQLNQVSLANVGLDITHVRCKRKRSPTFRGRASRLASIGYDKTDNIRSRVWFAILRRLSDVRADCSVGV
jgi:ribosomal protein L37E